MPDDLNMRSHNRLDVMGITNYEDRQGETRSWWTKIGSAFWNKDGSLNVKLDYIPTSPKQTIQIRPPREKKEVGQSDDGGGRRPGRSDVPF